tara:strand:- start:18 stop:416 length:399 start_codon:yes stop_codon:yes gene_type:complete
MATEKRTYPNSNFAWYNDDNRLAIVCQDNTAVSGESTQEKYDTYQDADVTAGLRITYSSKFETVDAQADDLKTNIGLDSGLHTSVVCYLKARMFEDMGDLQRAQYFRAMYEKMMKQYPTKKSGVRALAVPRL